MGIFSHFVVVLLAFLMLSCSNDASRDKKNTVASRKQTTTQPTPEQRFEKLFAQSIPATSHMVHIRAEQHLPESEMEDDWNRSWGWFGTRGRILQADDVDRIIILPAIPEIQTLGQSELLFAFMSESAISNIRFDFLEMPRYLNAKNSEALCPDGNCPGRVAIEGFGLLYRVYFEDLPNFVSYYDRFAKLSPLRRKAAADSFETALLDAHKYYRAKASKLNEPIFNVKMSGIELTEYNYSVDDSVFYVNGRFHNPFRTALANAVYGACGAKVVCESKYGWYAPEQLVIKFPTMTIDNAEKLIASKDFSGVSVTLLYQFYGFTLCTEGGSQCNLDFPEIMPDWLRKEQAHLNPPKILGRIKVVAYKAKIDIGGTSHTSVKIM